MLHVILNFRLGYDAVGFIYVCKTINIKLINLNILSIDSCHKKLVNYIDMQNIDTPT